MAHDLQPFPLRPRRVAGYRLAGRDGAKCKQANDLEFPAPRNLWPPSCTPSAGEEICIRPPVASSPIRSVSDASEADPEM